MKDSSKKDKISSPDASITAADLSRIIRRFSHIFGVGDMGNIATSDALAELSEYLYSLGPLPIAELCKARQVKAPSARQSSPEGYRNLSLAEVDAMLRDEGISKLNLMRLGRARFGMPESRLRRLALADVLEAIRAAAAHEESLNLIEKNAEASGRARQS